jgi:hypothetical protein
MANLTSLAQQLAETVCGTQPVEIAVVIAGALEGDARLVPISQELLNQTVLAVIALLATRAADDAITGSLRIGAATRNVLDAHRSIGLGGRETRAVYALAKEIYQQKQAMQRIEPMISDLAAGQLDMAGPPPWLVRHWGAIVVLLTVVAVLMLGFLLVPYLW